jgi:hypothetical protein
MHAFALFRSHILQSFILSNDASRPMLDLISYEQYVQRVDRKTFSFYSILHFTFPSQNIVAWTEYMRTARPSAGRMPRKNYAGARLCGTNDSSQSELGAACKGTVGRELSSESHAGSDKTNARWQCSSELKQTDSKTVSGCGKYLLQGTTKLILSVLIEQTAYRLL